MAILVDDGTRLLVQGITGRRARSTRKDATERHQGGRRGDAGQGRAGLRRRPRLRHRRGGRRRDGRERERDLRTSPFAADAIFESLDAGLSTICCITEGIPVHDMMRVANYLGTKDATLVGPNCPGVLSPEKANVSIMPRDIFMPGNVGVVSRSGTLTYQIVNELTQREIGQSTAVGIGGDPIIGTDFIEILSKFEADPETECAVMIGEIGGNAEQLAAEYVSSEMSIPVVAYIAGFTAPRARPWGTRAPSSPAARARQRPRARRSGRLASGRRRIHPRSPSWSPRHSAGAERQGICRTKRSDPRSPIPYTSWAHHERVSSNPGNPRLGQRRSGRLSRFEAACRQEFVRWLWRSASKRCRGPRPGREKCSMRGGRSSA